MATVGQLREPDTSELRYLRGVLFDNATIQRRAAQAVTELKASFGRVDVLVCIMTGARHWADLIARRLPDANRVNCSVSFYRSGDFSLRSDGVLERLNLEGKRVLVLEDVVGTGRTLHYVLTTLRRSEAAAVGVCPLLNNPSIRAERFRDLDKLCHGTGFVVDSGEFVCGYGIRGMAPAPSSLRELRDIYLTHPPTSLTHTD